MYGLPCSVPASPTFFDRCFKEVNSNVHRMEEKMHFQESLGTSAVYWELRLGPIVNSK